MIGLAAAAPLQATFYCFNVISILNDTNAIVSPVYNGVGTTIGSLFPVAASSYYIYRPGLQSLGLQKQTLPNRRCGKNNIFMNFQPSLGIFDLHQGIGSGDFKFQLNPNVNFQTSCIESVGYLRPVKQDTAANYRGQYEVVPFGPIAPGTITAGATARQTRMRWRPRSSPLPTRCRSRRWMLRWCSRRRCACRTASSPAAAIAIRPT